MLSNLTYAIQLRIRRRPLEFNRPNRFTFYYYYFRVFCLFFFSNNLIEGLISKMDVFFIDWTSIESAALLRMHCYRIQIDSEKSEQQQTHWYMDCILVTSTTIQNSRMCEWIKTAIPTKASWIKVYTKRTRIEVCCCIKKEEQSDWNTRNSHKKRGLSVCM